MAYIIYKGAKDMVDTTHPGTKSNSVYQILVFFGSVTVISTKIMLKL